jgi:hypothetical protein
LVTVRVTLKRGRFRVVVGVSSVWLSGGRSVSAVVGLADVVVLDDPGVVDPDVDVVDDGSLISVVTGGLVLVIVPLVVDDIVVLPKTGSTNWGGAWMGSPAWRATNITPATARPIAAAAATLAPNTARVDWCHGLAGSRPSSRSSPVTGTDSNGVRLAAPGHPNLGMTSAAKNSR